MALAPPKTVKNGSETQDWEDYLRDIAFFLTVGEQAPFKSAAEVYQLSPRDRNAWVEKLSDLYKKQKEEMDAANRRAKQR